MRILGNIFVVLSVVCFILGLVSAQWAVAFIGLLSGLAVGVVLIALQEILDVLKSIDKNIKTFLNQSQNSRSIENTSKLSIESNESRPTASRDTVFVDKEDEIIGRLSQKGYLVICEGDYPNRIFKIKKEFLTKATCSSIEELESFERSNG